MQMMPDAAIDDEIDNLSKAAARMEAEQKAKAAMTQARAHLVLGDWTAGDRSRRVRMQTPRSVFFATLAMRLKLAVRWDIQTACTEGRHIFYSPDYVASLNEEGVLGLIAEEVMHNSNAHFARRGNRDPKIFNIACDAAILPLLKKAGFLIPDHCAMPGVGPLKNMPPDGSAETNYAWLMQNLPPGGGCWGDHFGGGGGYGDVIDAPDPAQAEAITSDWKIAVAQAAESARKRGTMPAGLEMFIKDVLEPKVDWRDELRLFVHANAKTDYSWAPPNRRLLSYGLYLPGVGGESLAPGIIAIDASGSCWSDEIQRQFAGEVQAIAEQFKSPLTLLFHDTEIAKVVRWEPGEGDLVLDGPAGGGGTSHVAIWDWIEEQDTPPEWVVALTDNETDHGKDPGIPVLWAVIGGCKTLPPFGRRIEIE